MKAKILEKLKEIENEHKIKILYACESGSRAWGFESPDSDFDIRFIYVNKLDYYLSIENKRDTIEIVDGELDFVGWDLKKALYLLRKSNPSLIEWLNSPIVYLKDEEFFNRFSDLMKKAFNIKALMYHYLHMAKTNYREYLKGDLVKIKKYFYVLRPILALKWLEDKRSIPPIEFNKLLNSVNIPEEIKKEILKLLEKKKVKKELDLEPRIEILNEFIEENISYYERYLKNLDVNIKPLEAKEFDDLLKEMIFKYDLEACYSLSKLKK
jgi:predicted nucleotidyltransferase